MKTHIILLLTIMLLSCKSKVEKIKPMVEPITESIYASGIIKSKNQYNAYATVNGIIEYIYLHEGDKVHIGTPILSIANQTQELNRENAALNAKFSDFNANKGKLNDALLNIEFAKNKLDNDSELFVKQKALWQQQVGTEIELSQKELSFQNAKTNYLSSIIKYQDLKRQLNFNSSQSKKNLKIYDKLASDYTLKSQIEGVIYNLDKSVGDQVSIQTPLAVIGDDKAFVLEMQVDEYDISQIKIGLAVLVTMDSYKGSVFEAKVIRITPFMNERSKTFTVEAEFVKGPAVLYPNSTFEANIVLKTKSKALLIPRMYLMNDSMVVKKNGDKVMVKTGLKDYQKIEILSGLTADDELIKPVQ